MAWAVEIHVSPASEPPAPKPGVVVEIAFDAEIDSGAHTAETVRRTVRVSLDERLSGATRLESVQGPTVRVGVLAADGAALVTRTVVIVGDRADVVLSDDEVARIRDGGQLLPDTVAPKLVRRSVRLVPTSSMRPTYASTLADAVAVAVAGSAEQLKASGLEDLLQTGGGRFVAAIELAGAARSAVGRIGWSPAHVAVDGSFLAEIADGAVRGLAVVAGG